MDRRTAMRRKLFKNHKKMSTGKLVTGVLVGGVLGATVGWLTTPASVGELRRRLQGDRTNLHEKIETSEGNVESQARELTEEMSNTSVGF
jgi:gas vesicle protein